MPQVSGGAALEYLGRLFHGSFRDYEEVVLVSGAVIPLVGGDADRVSLTLVNLGTVAVYVSPEPNVTAARGIRLGGGGGLLSFNVWQDSILPILPLWSMTTVANQPVFIIRVRRETIIKPDEAGP